MGDNNKAGAGWGQLGMQVAGGVAGQAMGMALGNYNDRRQRMQQDKLWQMEMKNRKEMTDYEMEKQYEMWLKTNYGAQKGQMKEAGINPALMYGMSGGGGAMMGSAGGNVSGGTAASSSNEGMGMANMGIQTAAQLKLLQAQKENIEADTANKRAEIPGKEGIPSVQQQGIKESQQNIEESKGRVNLMAQQEDNARWAQELQRVDLAIKNNEKWISESTMDSAVRKFNTELNNAIAETRSKMVQAKIDEKTIDSKIEQIRAAAVGETIHNQLMKAQINVSEQQVTNMINEVAQRWQGLRIEEQEMYVKQYLAKITSAAIPGYILTGAAQTITSGLKQGTTINDSRKTTNVFENNKLH